MAKIEGIEIDGKTIAQIIKDARADERAKIRKKVATIANIAMKLHQEIESIVSRFKSEKPGQPQREAKASVATVVTSNGNGHHSADTVMQAVHKYIATRGDAQDAKSVVAGTNIPEPSVRWAFVKLMEAGSLRRESRGRYAIAHAPQEEHESLN